MSQPGVVQCPGCSEPSCFRTTLLGFRLAVGGSEQGSLLICVLQTFGGHQWTQKLHGCCDSKFVPAGCEMPVSDDVGLFGAVLKCCGDVG